MDHACGEREHRYVLDCLKGVAVFDRPGALERLRARLERPEDRLAAAQTLLALGAPDGVPVLIGMLAAASAPARGVYGSLLSYTHHYIPYDAEGSSEARAAAAGAWRQWWERQTGTFVDAHCDRPALTAWTCGETVGWRGRVALPRQ